MAHDNHRKKAMPCDWTPESPDGGIATSRVTEHYFNDGDRTEGNFQRDPDDIDPPRDLDPFRMRDPAPLKRAHHGS